MVLKINLDASTESIIEPSSFLMTLRNTINRGINNDVTNNGIASVAQSSEAHTNIAKQFFCATSSNGDILSKIIVIVAMITNLTSTGFPIDILNELKLPPLAFKSVSLSLVAPSARSNNLEFAAYVFLSNPIISLHTVFLSQTTCSLKWIDNSCLAVSKSSP